MITEILKETYRTLFRKPDRSFFLHNEEMSSTVLAETQQWKEYLYLKRKYAWIRETLPPCEIGSVHPRIIWWCWLQGEDQAPLLCKACLTSLRRELPDYEIRIVDYKNLESYIEIPDYIMEKHRNGIFGGAHFSDIVRTMLLVKYGGVWIDSSVYCTGYHTPLLEEPLFAYQNWKFDQPYASVVSSWLIAAAQGHPILCAVQALLLEYWRHEDTLLEYYLFHLFFHLATEWYPDLWKAEPRYSNIPPHVLQFELFEPYREERFCQLAQMSDFHKLNWKAAGLQGDTKNTFYEHLIHA